MLNLWQTIVRRNRLTEALRYWGNCEERQALHSGFPKISPMWQLALAKRGPIIDGHKILCLDFPARYRKIDRAIRLLGQTSYRALWLKYAWDRDERGRPVTDAERGKVLGISRGDFAIRVLRARRSLAQRKSLIHKA